MRIKISKHGGGPKQNHFNACFTSAIYVRRGSIGRIANKKSPIGKSAFDFVKQKPIFFIFEQVRSSQDSIDREKKDEDIFEWEQARV